MAKASSEAKFRDDRNSRLRILIEEALANARIQYTDVRAAPGGGVAVWLSPNETEELVSWLKAQGEDC